MGVAGSFDVRCNTHGSYSDERGTGLESRAIEGNSPVDKTCAMCTKETPEYNGTREDHLARLNTPQRPIVNKYREGKVKSTPARGVKENLKPCAYKPLEP